MTAFYYIALNTFKETVRNKVLYVVFFFAAAVLALAINFGDWSVFARVQVMEDFGLAAMSLCGLMLAVFVGVGMLGQEIATKTVYNLLTRPISRSQVIIGKFSGLLAVVTIVFICMSAWFLAVLWLVGGVWDIKIVQAVALCGVEMAVLIAAAIFFSTIASPTLSAMFTIGLFCAGHLNDLVLQSLTVMPQRTYSSVLNALYYIIPNLEHFNIRTRIVYDLAIPHGFTLWATLYGLLYATLFLSMAVVFFSRKDL